MSEELYNQLRNERRKCSKCGQLPRTTPTGEAGEALEALDVLSEAAHGCGRTSNQELDQAELIISRALLAYRGDEE